MFLVLCCGGEESEESDCVAGEVFAGGCESSSSSGLWVLIASAWDPTVEQSNQLQITEHILGKTEHCHGNNTKNYTTHIGDGGEKEREGEGGGEGDG